MRFIRFRAGRRLLPTTPPSPRMPTPFEAFPLQHSGNPSPDGIADQTERPKTHCRSTTPPVHRSPYPSRRSLQQNRPTPKCCLALPDAALRGVTMPEVRCLHAALPRHSARCSLGLLLDFRLSPQNCSRHCPPKWTLPRHSDPVPTPKCVTWTAPTHCPELTPSSLAGPPKRTARCERLPAEADREPRTLRKTTLPTLDHSEPLARSSRDRGLAYRKNPKTVHSSSGAQPSRRFCRNKTAAAGATAFHLLPLRPGDVTDETNTDTRSAHTRKHAPR
jgi:hypothetical protein